MALATLIVPVTPFRQNCTLLYDPATPGGPVTVVDPGGDEPQIMAALDRLGRPVEQILLTHGHIDHAGGVAGLRDQLMAVGGPPVPVIGPQVADRFLLDTLAEQGRLFGLMAARPVTPNRFLAAGDQVRIGGRDFAVLHCPGHTPGHVVFIDAPGGLAIVGDVLFRGSVGRTDFPYSDTAALHAAIHTQLLPLGDAIGFVCGHGPGSTFGVERRTNPYLQPGAL